MPARLRGVLAVLLALLLIVPLIGLGIVRLQAPRAQEEAHADLAGIADLKVGQIELWLGERRGDANVLAASPDFVGHAARWIEHRDADARRQLLEHLDLLKVIYRYDGWEVLDAAGRPRLASGTSRAGAEPAVQEALRAAWQSGAAQVTELYRNGAGRIALSIVGPLFMSPDGRRDPLGALVLHAPVQGFLFPLIQSWPTPSPSAETLLVRRDGNDVVYLNELRHRHGAALDYRRPLDTQNLPAARAAVSDQPQVMAGIDYRGVRVLAAVRPVNGTSWRLVAKVDRDEILMPLNNLVFWVGLVTAIAVGVVAAAVLLLWRQELRAHRLELIAQTAEKDRLLKFFFELPFVGMAITSPEAKGLLRFNDRLCEILGYPREELARLAWSEVTHPDDLATETSLFKDVLAGTREGYHIDKRFIRKDGKVIDATIDVKAVRRADGSAEFLVGTLADITGRKRAEQALRENQRRLRFALESARIGDWDLDLTTGKVLRSLEHDRCFGAKRPFAEWGYEKFLTYVHPEDRSHVRSVFEGALAQQKEWHFECRVVWPDASVHWIEAHGAIYRRAEGKPSHMAGIVQDITRRKQVEQDIRESGARLRQANEQLHKLTAYLENVREEERLRIARELHDELGSTLTGIKWAVSMSIDRAQAAGMTYDPQLAHASQLLDTAVDTMRRVIADLRPSVLDQLGVWAAIEWYVGQTQERSGLACTLSISPATAQSQLDAERSVAVFRIVQEALTNVVRHAHASHVSIQVENAHDSVTIKIEDDGVGICDEALLNAESWGIVGMHERASRFGGEIRLDGGPEAGTTLLLRMPV